VTDRQTDGRAIAYGDSIYAQHICCRAQKNSYAKQLGLKTKHSNMKST